MGGAATAFVGIGMSAAIAPLETPSAAAKVSAMSATDPRERAQLMSSPCAFGPKCCRSCTSAVSIALPRYVAGNLECELFLRQSKPLKTRRGTSAIVCGKHGTASKIG